MKAITLFTLAILLTCSFAQAQINSLNNKPTTYLGKQLNITDSIAKQVETILADYKTNANKVTDNKKLNAAEMRTKIDALIEDKNIKLKKILTEEQLFKFLPTTEKKKN